MATQIAGTVAGQGVDVSVTPTVTAGSYSAGNCIGGVLAFPLALFVTKDAEIANFNGILESITIRFKASTQTTELDFVLLSGPPATPANYADHATPTYASVDDALILGCYALTSALSPLGTHTVYNLDGIGKQFVATSTSLTGLVICKAALAASPASVSDMTVRLGIMW